MFLGRFGLVGAVDVDVTVVGVGGEAVAAVMVEVMAAEIDCSNVVRELAWNPSHMCSLMPWKRRYMS